MLRSSVEENSAQYCVFAQYPCPPSQPKCYNPRHPERTLLYQTVAEHYETWLELASAGQFDGQGDHHSPKPYVRQAFEKYLKCGIFAHGFARARCGDCGHDFLVAFSCKGRGVCLSCNTRRMVEAAAHLSDHVFPRLAGAPVGVVCAQAAALLHAARWPGAGHGAAYLPAGYCANAASQQPWCGQCGQGSFAHRRSRLHPPLRLQCRTLRSISASVGSVAKGVVTAVLPTLRCRAAPVAAQNGAYRQTSGDWPAVSIQADPV